MNLFNKDKDLSRNDILKVNDIAIERVEVPEWGGSVYVKGLTAAERSDLVESMSDGRGEDRKVNTANMRELLLSSTLCDKDGVLLFTNKDVSALGKKAAAPVERLFKIASRFSGLGDEDVEEMTEALEANPLDGSVSD